MADETTNGSDEPKAKKRKLRPLPGLDVDEFRHPNDARATDALKKIPGIDTLIKKVMEYGLERLYYVENLSSNDFLRQVREFEDVDRTTLDRAYKVLLTLFRDHPFAMQRARELDAWGDGFETILAKRSSRLP